MKLHLTNIIISVLLLLIAGCKSDDGTTVPPDDDGGGVLPITELFEFQFNESTGTTTSESNTGNSFPIMGRGINRMPGVTGNALFFDGLSNEISGSLTTSDLPTDRIIVSLWVSPKSYPIGTASMLALTQEGSSTGMMIGINKSGRMVVQYFINGGFFQQVTNEVIPRDQWNHIVVGLNTTDRNISIYLNNSPVRNSNISAGSISWPAGNTPISIGKNTMSEMKGIFDIDHFSGALDEVRIYNGMLSSDVVSTIRSEYSPPQNVQYVINIDYSGDANRPTYHAIPDYGWANESYGLIFQDNQYHMFYQKNDVFLGIAQQNWGHFTSNDLINWDEQNAVLWPSPQGWDNFGCWSGSSIELNDGTPAVVYTGVDGIKAGIGVATSSDNYQTLDKYSENPVVPVAPSDVDLDFRDPFVWEKDGLYHMLVGSGKSLVGGNVVYYNSPDFSNWSYQGIAFQGSIGSGEGAFWEVPILYEFPNGKEMLLVQKTPDNTPARTFYWIGQFENGTFTPDFAQAKNLEVVNGFLSPTVTKDTNGSITAIGIIPDEVASEFQMEQGWANLFSVPQVWELDGSNTINIKPHPNLSSLRGNEISFSGISLKEGGSNYLNDYSSRHFEISTTINTGTASQIGFILGKSPGGEEEYKVFYDMTTQEWVVDASNSSLDTRVRRDIRKGGYSITPGSTVGVRIFIDGSVLEVFVDDKAHFTGRFFPTFTNASGVDLFVKGGTATADVSLYEISN